MVGRLTKPVLAAAALLAALVFSSGLLSANESEAANSAPVHESAPRARAATPQDTYLWGAWIGSQLTGKRPPWDFTAVTKFEQMAGKSVSLLQFSSPFSDCSTSPCKPYTFPDTPFDAIRDHGAIPFFSWNSASYPVQVNQPDFQLSDVASGRYDDYIRSWAKAAAKWGHPFFLRFNWEMNGDWFPWGVGVNGNKNNDYVRAWRHVHDLFTQAGASNARWVWCPNIDPRGTRAPLAQLYPGDKYVDWTCIDGYAWNGTRADSFSSLINRVYQQITKRIAPGKPMVIGETAAPEDGGKAKWIADLFASLPDYPAIRALLWFEAIDQQRPTYKWPIESSSGAVAAFRAGISDRKFSANRWSGLSESTLSSLVD